jgi:hypothetical protein
MNVKSLLGFWGYCRHGVPRWPRGAVTKVGGKNSRPDVLDFVCERYCNVPREENGR